MKCCTTSSISIVSMMFCFILNILCKVYFIVEFSLFLRVKRIEFKPSKNSSVRTFLCVRKDRHMPSDNILSDARSDELSEGI